jgi:hypothetical protein
MALSAKFPVCAAIAHANLAQFFLVKARLAQFPAPSSSVGVVSMRRRGPIVAGRRDGADNSACGYAAENARADGAADAVCICWCWSDHGSNANARGAD